MLVSPAGDVVMTSGDLAEVDLAHVARVAHGLGGGGDVVSFKHENVCVHAAPVAVGWVLCVLSTVGAAPNVIVERLGRASRVLALALADGPGPVRDDGGAGGGAAPAEVFASRLPSRRS